VLGRGRLGQIELIGQLTHDAWALAQQIEHGAAVRIDQHGPDLVGHPRDMP
jgi:hypothetical protein